MPADATVPDLPGATISPDGPTVPLAESSSGNRPNSSPNPNTGDEETLPLAIPTEATVPIPAKQVAPAQLTKVEPVKVQPAEAQPAKAQPAEVQVAKVQPAEVQPAKAQPAKAVPAKPEVWSGRVAIPGAVGPGQKKTAAPTAPTQKMARIAEPTPTVVAPRPVAPRPVTPSRPLAPSRTRRKRSLFKRFLAALIALLLLLAVPVVAAYMAYKLASGENPFDWPPTVDLSHVF
jgi:hypothetical protein